MQTGASEPELKALLKAELNRDESSTYFRYLRNRRDIFVYKHGDAYSFINTINVRMAEKAQLIDYEWKDYAQPLLKEASGGNTEFAQSIKVFEMLAAV